MTARIAACAHMRASTPWKCLRPGIFKTSGKSLPPSSWHQVGLHADCSCLTTWLKASQGQGGAEESVQPGFLQATAPSSHAHGALAAV